MLPITFTSSVYGTLDYQITYINDTVTKYSVKYRKKA